MITSQCFDYGAQRRVGLHIAGRVRISTTVKNRARGRTAPMRETAETRLSLKAGFIESRANRNKNKFLH